MEYVSVDKEICCVANLIRKEFDNLVFGSVYSEERITRMNIWIIDYIYDKKGEDVFQKDIERKMSITRSTASKIIDLMVQKKLVERSAVGYDARLKKVMAGFSEEEEQLLLSYILRIKGNMDSGA